MGVQRDRYSLRWLGNAGTEGHMRASAVVMSRPLADEGADLPFAERNDPVEAFAAERTDHSLAEGIGLRRARRRLQDLDTEVGDRGIEIC